MARHTENAKAELQAARAAIGQTSPSDPLNVYRLHMARAQTEIASALADIYDKLQAMDRKIK